MTERKGVTNEDAPRVVTEQVVRLRTAWIEAAQSGGGGVAELGLFEPVLEGKVEDAQAGDPGVLVLREELSESHAVVRVQRERGEKRRRTLGSSRRIWKSCRRALVNAGRHKRAADWVAPLMQLSPHDFEGERGVAEVGGCCGIDAGMYTEVEDILAQARITQPQYSPQRRGRYGHPDGRFGIVHVLGSVEDVAEPVKVDPEVGGMDPELDPVDGFEDDVAVGRVERRRLGSSYTRRTLTEGTEPRQRVVEGGVRTVRVAGVCTRGQVGVGPLRRVRVRTLGRVTEDEPTFARFAEAAVSVGGHETGHHGGGGRRELAGGAFERERGRRRRRHGRDERRRSWHARLLIDQRREALGTAQGQNGIRTASGTANGRRTEQRGLDRTSDQDTHGFGYAGIGCLSLG